MKQRKIAMMLSYLIFSLTSFSLQLFAQDKHLTSPDPQQLAFVDMNDNRGTFFLSAERMKTNKSNTDNKNLYRNSWLPGVEQFKTGKQYRDCLLKFDIDNNRLFFNNGGKPNIFAEAVVGFTLLDTIGGQVNVARFNNGYSAFGKQSTSTFYQVLAYGKNALLLKYFSKYIAENQGFNTMTTFDYKIVEDYYVYNVATGEIKLIKKTPSSFYKALPAFEAQIGNLNAPKKLEENDMSDLVNAVNKL